MEKADTVLRLMENVIFLKKYTLLSGLDTEDLRAVAAIAREVQVGNGECVVRENDAGDSFFVIRSGELRIVKGDKGSEVELAVLQKYSCFGEMALFEENALRSASVYARGDCALLRIGRDDFLAAIRKQPHIGIEMCKIFVKRLQETNLKLMARSKPNEK